MILELIVLLMLPTFDDDTRFTGWLWYETPGNYYQAQVWESSDPTKYCAGKRACAWAGLGSNSLIILPENDAHGFNANGCTNQTHEWMHLMGLSENEIPKGCLGYGNNKTTVISKHDL